MTMTIPVARVCGGGLIDLSAEALRTEFHVGRFFYDFAIVCVLHETIGFEAGFLQ